MTLLVVVVVIEAAAPGIVTDLQTAGIDIEDSIA